MDLLRLLLLIETTYCLVMFFIVLWQAASNRKYIPPTERVQTILFVWFGLGYCTWTVGECLHRWNSNLTWRFWIVAPTMLCGIIALKIFFLKKRYE